MIYLNQTSTKFQKAFHPSSNSPTKYPNPLPDIHPITLVHKNQRQHVYTAEVAGEREHLKTGIDTSRERKRERERWGRENLYRQVLLVRNAWSFCRAAQSKAAPGVLQFRPLSTPPGPPRKSLYLSRYFPNSDVPSGGFSSFVVTTTIPLLS